MPSLPAPGVVGSGSGPVVSNASRSGASPSTTRTYTNAAAYTVTATATGTARTNFHHRRMSASCRPHLGAPSAVPGKLLSDAAGVSYGGCSGESDLTPHPI